LPIRENHLSFNRKILVILLDLTIDAGIALLVRMRFSSYFTGSKMADIVVSS
jgi:hypothetical protein